MSSTPSPSRAAFAAAGASAGAVFLLALPGLALAGAHIIVIAYVLVLSLSAFVVALLHAVGLGLPVYYLLAPQWRASLPATLCASFLIGAIPLPLLSVLSFFFEGPVSVWSENGPILVHPRLTMHLLLEILPVAATLGVLGMVGGIAFWRAMRPHRSPGGSNEIS